MDMKGRRPLSIHQGHLAEGELDVSLTYSDQARVLHDIFERTSSLFPQHCAIEHRGVRFSYLEVDVMANQLAHFLLQQGVHVGSRVSIWLPRSVEQSISILGVMKAGATYVPLDESCPTDRARDILEDAQVTLLLTNKAVINGQTYNTNVIFWDDLHHLINDFPSHPPTRKGQTSDSLCYIIYTSGSTGRPKGVKVSHRNIIHYVDAIRKVHPAHAQDRVYQGFSISFDASLEEIWLAFSSGATLVIGESVPTSEWLSRMGITVLGCVPTLLSMLDGDIPSLRLVLLGGEACPSQLIQRWYSPQREIYNCYGPTEATVAATYAVCDPNHSVTIGKAYPGYKVVLLNEAFAAANEGEICIGGPGVSEGYVNREELTNEKFVAWPTGSNNRFYRTGDLGRYDGQGNIVFLGRIDSQVKIRGYRIELEEIESVLISYTGIQQAAVIACPDASGTVNLVAHLVTVTSINEHCLLEHLKRSLPPYMIPTFIHYVDSLPLLTSGKLDRKSIPADGDLKRLVDRHDHREDRAFWSYEEQQLADIWRQLLKLDEVGLNDNFFDLGGHSLLAAKMFSDIETEFHQVLPVSVIFEADTIAKLANLLVTGNGHDNTSSLVTMQRGESATAIFCIHNVDGEVVAYRQFIKHFKDQYSIYGVRYSQNQTGSRPTVTELARRYVEDIRRVHPAGPVVLIGHSLGGVIAFEMARQFTAHKQHVHLLAMIDTTQPEYTFERMSLWQKTVNDLKIARSMSFQHLWSFLLRKFRNLLASGLQRSAREQSVQPLGSTRSQELIHAACFYTPVRDVEKIVLFRASKRKADDVILDETLGWGKVAPVDVYHVAASHNSILEEPHVTEIATRVMNYLGSV